MNYLITGGAGFIGSNLAHRLTEMEQEVAVIDKCLPNTGYNLRNLTGLNVSFIEADIADYEKTKEAIKQADVVFNLAGMTSHINSMKEPLEDTQNNLISHINFLENCKQLNDDALIIFAGTRSQYGKTEKIPVDETTKENPLDVNGINKSAAEKFHLLYSKTYGMNITSLRLTNIYGPRSAISKSHLGFIGYFIGTALRGKPVEVFAGSQKRDILFVEDLVDAFLRINKNHSGEIFNVGSGNAASVLEIAKSITSMTGTELVVKNHPGDHGKIEIGDFVCDIGKIKGRTGWSPKTGYKDGIRKTLDFYAVNGLHW